VEQISALHRLSTVTFNGTTATATSWSDTSIQVTVPNGATTGNILATVSNAASNGVSFRVTSLPLGWLDGDVGSVGLAGSASYANGAFTVTGSGQYISGVADAFHYVYQPLSGDGMILARVVSLQGSWAQAGVMIRETLDSYSTNAFMAYQNNANPPVLFLNRVSTGVTTSSTSSSGSLPYWVKVIRSGSTFTGYASPDGASWTQAGSSVTINMAQTVYFGLTVSGNTNTALATAVFDNVSFALCDS
jgi:hypothetical protein